MTTAVPANHDPPVDPERLAESIRELAASLRDEARQSEPVFFSDRDGLRLGAILLKRTYKVEAGACVLAPAEDQAPLNFREVPYAKLPLPRVAPIVAGDERYVFKAGTDLVIQASAQAYEPNVRKTTAGFRFGKVEREITVHGDRRGEVDALGRFRFSEAEAFESMPIRWDHAYGGYDKTAAKRGGLAYLKQMKRVRPEWEVSMTKYHYPRNPCGSGYLVSLDEESFTGLAIPNLEHPFAPLTPERLAVGHILRWHRGLLPAAWDFQSVGWFPRSAYLGLSPSYHEPDEAFTFAEVERGWAPKDIWRSKPLVHLDDPNEARLEIGNSAAPGMTFPEIAADERIELRNLHPRKPTHTVPLPGEVPVVHFELEPGVLTEALPQLNQVVLRVDLNEVELLWSARVPLPDKITEADLLDVRRVVRWKRGAEKG